MNRRSRSSDESGRVVDAESERRFIYARRENIPAHTRSGGQPKGEAGKGRSSARRGA